MPSYGPWIQEPDYDGIATWRDSRRRDELEARFIPVDRSQVADFMFYEEGWFPVEDGSMMELLAAAKLNAPIEDSASRFTTGYGTTLSHQHTSGTVGVDNWGSGGAAVIRHHPHFADINEIIPFYPGDSGADVEFPEDAIGVEFDDGEGLAQWTECAIAANSEMFGRNLDGTGSVNAPITTPATTQILVQTLEEATTMSLGGSAVGLVVGTAEEILLGDEIVITEHMRPEGVVIYTVTDHFLPPQNADNPTLFAPNDFWHYGYGFETLRLRIRLHPPRYRWIYDTEPIRRTYPRDDGLAGGAGRTWPPPRSAQSSGRVFGGYL